MKIKLISIGKTDEKALRELIQKYEARLKHYISFSLEVIPDLKTEKTSQNIFKKIKRLH
jgi:23S rRNA (pseudouridine1915-N3)-methyltransferase